MQTQNNIFAALGLHTAKMLIIKYVTWRFVVALLHCAPYSGNNLCDVCLRHLPSFALFRSPVRFLWGSVTLYPLLFSFCLSALTFSLLLFFLALGWWQSGIWVMCLLFHDMLCCVTAAAWSLSLLPPPPSSPRKPTEFNVRVCLRRPN